jgi:hypothetical protein
LIGQKISHYTILDKLGEGGMGTVYLAEDNNLGRRVALKMLPAATAGDPKRLERFRRDAQAVASLNHPNIVTLHSIEESPEGLFITMEARRSRGPASTSSSRAAASPSSAGWRSPGRWSRRSPPPTPAGSRTAISSRRTSW